MKEKSMENRKEKPYGNNMKSLIVLSSGLFIITFIGLFIYLFTYTTECLVTGYWIRHYQRETGVLIVTLFVNIFAVFAWFIARKKRWVANLCDYISDAFLKCKENHKYLYSENKAAHIFTIFVSLILFVFFFGLFISICFFNISSPMMDELLDMKRQLLMALVFFSVVLVLYKVFATLKKLCVAADMSFTTRLLITFVFLFTLQVILAINISTWIGWDAGTVVGEAAKAVNNAPIESGSLSMYPNNLLLFFILHQILRFFTFIGITDNWLGLSIVNILMIDIALLASIITVRKVYPSEDRRLTLLILFSLLIGLSPWIIVPYSDTFLMPFVSLVILLCFQTTQAKTTAKRILFASAAGILFALGWLIKPIIIAIPAALVITGLVYIIHVRGKIKLRLAAPVLLSSSLAIALTIGAFNLYVENQNIVELNKSVRVPMSYTIATGLVSEYSVYSRSLYGAWNFETAKYNHGTTQEKNENFNALIRERLQNHGVFGYTRFLVNKARWITSEGNFFWLGEGAGTADFSNVDGNFLRELFYTNGKHYPFYLHAANGLWTVVFLGLCIGMLVPCLTGQNKTKQGGNSDLFIRLNVFSIIFVILLTEGRSRYLIGFLPVFCIISANGYSYLKILIKNTFTRDPYPLHNATTAPPV